MHGRLGASARKATAVAVNPDLSTATAAVRRSAASLGARLTPGDVPSRVAARLSHLTAHDVVDAEVRAVLGEMGNDRLS